MAERLFMPHDQVRKASYSVEVEKNIKLVTSDGVMLVADIYHPVSVEKLPTILVRIPFSNTLSNAVKASVTAQFWATRGYHVVL